MQVGLAFDGSRFRSISISSRSEIGDIGAAKELALNTAATWGALKNRLEKKSFLSGDTFYE